MTPIGRMFMIYVIVLFVAIGMCNILHTWFIKNDISYIRFLTIVIISYSLTYFILCAPMIYGNYKLVFINTTRQMEVVSNDNKP